ncbi:MAG: NPCBM/NEW2 domain-containing protein, partial [Planctomycetota bacterium]
QPVRAEFPELMLETTGPGFRVRGRVVSETPVYGIVAYTDPVGGGDYDATTQCAVPDEAGRFAIDCEALQKGKSGELRLVTCHVNGKISSERLSYVVPRDGRVDLSESISRLQLRAFVAAVRAGNRNKAEALSGQLAERPRSIARRVLKSRFGLPPTKTAVEIADSVLSIGLTDVRPESASVGWIAPRYDSLPDDRVVISAGGRLFERGIYAHAKAEHRYQLAGKWRRLKGQVGVATGHPGSVVFVVSLDGAELWRSKMIQEGRLAAFDVDVTRGGELQLTVENGGDGNGADWAVWLNPRLER